MTKVWGWGLPIYWCPSLFVSTAPTAQLPVLAHSPDITPETSSLGVLCPSQHMSKHQCDYTAWIGTRALLPALTLFLTSVAPGYWAHSLLCCVL
mmetsp:Transcript_141269/g.246330  ORF Transcript_141269/g.246330 Transcript_141269/m.246330 type:complete len:94 (-) Transcript_141269:330-611(-)